MNKRLLSITDENSISITAEFLESGYVLKTGKHCYQRYEFDLIVRSDITCNQLLWAIHTALRQRLREKYGLNPDEIRGRTVYEDMLYPSGKNTRKNGRLYSRKKHSATEDHTIEQMATYHPGMSAAEKEQLILVSCWNIFRECFAAYQQGYADTTQPTFQNLRDGTYGRHPVIARGCINLGAIPNGEPLSCAHNAQIWLTSDSDGRKTLQELGFITGSRLIFDPVMWHHSGTPFDSRNIRSDALARLPLHSTTGHANLEPVVQSFMLSAPNELPACSRTSIIANLLAPLTAAGALIGVWAAADIPMPVDMTLLAAVMTLSGLVVGLISRYVHRNVYHKDLHLWRKRYEAYVNQYLEQLCELRTQNADLLNRQYPPSLDPDTDRDLVHMALQISGSIFSRKPEHSDYLTVRLGRSVPGSHLVSSGIQLHSDIIPQTFSPIQYQNIRCKPNFPFKIVLPHQPLPAPVQTDGSSGFLNELPKAISDEYGYLIDAPVLLHLNQTPALGILFQDNSMDFLPYLSNLVLDLCFHHAPEDIQFVMLCEQTDNPYRQQDIIRRFKHLPHFRRLLGDLSPFVFNRSDAKKVFDRLQLLQVQMERSPQDRHAHIVVIAVQDYGLREHAIVRRIPHSSQQTANGISFLLCTHFESELPSYCAHIVKVTPEGNWFLLPNDCRVHTDSRSDIAAEQQYAFRPDTFVTPDSGITAAPRNDAYFRAFKALSGLYHDPTARSTLPMEIDLFTLLENSAPADNPVINLTHLSGQPDTAWIWKLRAELTSYVISQCTRKSPNNNLRDPIASLSVPFGMGTDSLVELDLHKNADGPNLLISSDPGMGKTQSILQYLTSLCAHYAADEVNLILVDPNHAGLNNRLRHLPHIVGSVSTLDDQGVYTDIAPHLRRLFHAIDQEMTQRRLLLNRMGVKNVDDYNRARKNIPEHVRNAFLRNPQKITDAVHSLEQLPGIPHLFLVMDNYHDLLNLTADPSSFIDLNAHILRLSSCCSDLGLHIILATNYADTHISRDIRNVFHSTLCLKTSRVDISHLLISSPLAASRHMPTAGRAYLFRSRTGQTEYIQVGYPDANIRRSLIAFFQITHMKPSGEYELFFDTDSIPDADLHSFLHSPQDIPGDEPLDTVNNVDAVHSRSETTYDTVRNTSSGRGPFREPTAESRPFVEPSVDPSEIPGSGKEKHSAPTENSPLISDILRNLTQSEITTLCIMDVHKHCAIPIPQRIYPTQSNPVNTVSN